VAQGRPHVDYSADYYTIFGSAKSRQPERRLMRAVLEHAIRAAQSDTKGPRARRERREALAWIMSEERSDVFAFENVCETLGISVKWLRAKLLAAPPLERIALPGATP